MLWLIIIGVVLAGLLLVVLVWLFGMDGFWFWTDVVDEIDAYDSHKGGSSYKEPADSQNHGQSKYDLVDLGE